MAVNLSPRQFADEHLLQDIDEALAASGMSPALLQLEVTESMVMRNVSRAVEGAGRDPEPRHSPCDRRFRNRLFVDVADEAVSDRHHQDRPFVRPRPGRRHRGPGDRPGDHQHGQGAGHDGRSPKAWKPPSRKHSCATTPATKCRAFCSASRSRPSELVDLLRSAPAMSSPPLQPAAVPEASDKPAARSKLRGVAS